MRDPIQPRRAPRVQAASARQAVFGAILYLLAALHAGLSARAALPDFTVLEAREFGTTNQMIVQFSATLSSTADATTTANYTLNPPSATVTAVTRHPLHPEMVIVRHTGTPADLIVRNVRNNAGLVVTPNRRTMIDRTPARPREAGMVVNGFQDSFASLKLDPAWRQYPEVVPAGAAGLKAFAPTNGVLVAKPAGSGIQRNWLAVANLPYHLTNQEVLIRIRSAGPESFTYVGGGAAVGLSFPNGPGTSFGNALEWVLRGPVTPPTVRLVNRLDSGTPPATTVSGTSRTNWLWLRLRHRPDYQPGVPDVEARVWLADGSTPEPLTGVSWNNWDPDRSLQNRPPEGLAGLVGPESIQSGVVTEYDYFLLKADGLPEITALPDGQQPPLAYSPGNLTGFAGETLQLKGAAAGDGPLTYQWRRDEIPLTGATQATLTLRRATALQSGKYDLMVRNPFGAATSGPAVVRIIGESSYANDFDATPAGPEWSQGTLNSSGGGRRLSLVGNQSVTLHTPRADDGRMALVTTDLSIEGFWSGLSRSDRSGPDVFEVGSPGGPRWLRTSFSNLDSSAAEIPRAYLDGQNFPAELGGPRFLGTFGANSTEYNSDFELESKYRLRFLVPATGPQTAVQFSASGLEPFNSGRWSLDNVVVTLLPTNEPIVRFQKRAYRVDEESGVLSIDVQRLGPLDSPLDIVITPIETGSAVAGVHYEVLTEPVRFAAGQTGSQLRLRLLPDPQPGPPREIRLKIDAPHLIPGDIAETVIVIDDAQSGFEVTTPNPIAVRENAGVVTLDVQGYGDLSTTRIVDFEIVPGSALANLWQTGTFHAVLPRFSRSGSVQLLLNDDSIDGPDRSFGINTTGAIGGRIRQERREVLLLDNDGPNRAGLGVAGYIYRLHPTADGKLLLQGAINSVHGRPISSLPRLLGDGLLDAAFKPEFMPLHPNAALAVLTDGSIIYAADINSNGGSSPNPLIRVTANGNRDATFRAEFDPPFSFQVTAQSDGKLILFGDFTTVNRQPRNGIARLQKNGALDTSFNAGAAADFSSIDRAYPFPGGRTLVTGFFSTFDGVDRNGLAVLKPDGRVDLGYEVDPEFSFGTELWLVLRDGRQIVHGDYYDNDFNLVSGLIQLDRSGKIKAPLPLNVNRNGFRPVAALELADGQVLLAFHETFPGDDRLVKLTADLSKISPTFRSSLPPGRFIRALAEMPDKSIVVAGDFLDLSGQYTSQLRRLNPNGSEAGWPGEAPAPRFTRLPVATTARTGERATFEAAGTGDEPVRYLWFKGLQPIPTATNAVLSLPNVQPGDANTYSVLLRTSTRDVQSPPVALTVLPPLAPPRLSIQRRAEMLTLDFQVEPGVGYRLETSVDLAAWELAEEFLATDPARSVAAPTASNLRYWRLRRSP